MTAREVDKKLLDLFWQLRQEDDKKQSLAVKTLSHRLLVSLKKVKDGEIPTEVQYCVSRLIKGLAASSEAARRGFLRCFELVVNGKSELSAAYLHENISKHLQITGAQSKSEATDTLRAQILAERAVLASGKVTDDEQIVDGVNRVLQAGSQKVSLVPLALETVTLLLEKVSQDSLRNTIWPILQPIICSTWEEQTSEKLSLLLKCSEKFPKVVSSKVLKKSLGTGEIASEETYPHLARILLTSEVPTSTYAADLYSYLYKHAKLPEFMPVLHETLEGQAKQKTTQNYLNFLTQLLEAGDVANFALVLSPSTCKILGEKTSENAKLVDKVTNLLQKKLALAETSDDAQANVAKAVLKAAKGEENAITAFGLLQVILPSLRAEAIKKVCSSLKKMIDDTEKKTKDRILALHQLTRAICHPSLKSDADFLEKTIFKLVSMTFKPFQIPRELVSSLKDQLFKIIESPSSDVEMWCHLLVKTLTQINEVLPADYFKVDGAVKSWGSVIVRLEELTAVAEKDWCNRIFTVLYAHAGILLLQDPTIVDEVLGDLDKCFEKSQKKPSKKRKSTIPDAEPSWVEVMTDMLLYLLGQNKASLRNMCNVTWKLLVPHLNQNALRTLLEVLKFTEEDGETYRPPVAKKSKTDDESGEDDDESEEESEMSDEEGGGGDTLIKLKMDLHRALGDNAAMTDQESIDLDDMDEENMKAVDAALSMAFQAHQAGKPNKKQTKQEAKESLARMHLKLRALDLVEITINQTADYKNILMIIPPLADSYCEAVRSNKQLQLQNRLRNALRSLRDWKPKDSSVELDATLLLDVIKQLIEMTHKSHAHASNVTEGLSLAFSCVLKLALQAEKPSTETPKKKKKLSKAPREILDILAGTLDDFVSGKSTIVPTHFIYKSLDFPSKMRQEVMSKLIEVSFSNTELGKQKRITLLQMIKNATRNASLVSESLENPGNFVEKIYQHSAETFSTAQFCKAEHNEIFEILNIIGPKVKTVSSFDKLVEELKKSVEAYNEKVAVTKDSRPAFSKLMTQFGLKYDKKNSSLPKGEKAATPLGPVKTKAERNAEKRKKKRQNIKKIREDKKKVKADKRAAKENEESADEQEAAVEPVTPKKKKDEKEGEKSAKKNKSDVVANIDTDDVEMETSESVTPQKKTEALTRDKSAKKKSKKTLELNDENVLADGIPKTPKTTAAQKEKNAQSVKKSKKKESKEEVQEDEAVTPKRKSEESGEKSSKKKVKSDVEKSAKKVNGLSEEKENVEEAKSPKQKGSKIPRRKLTADNN